MKAIQVTPWVQADMHETAGTELLVEILAQDTGPQMGLQASTVHPF